MQEQQIDFAEPIGIVRVNRLELNYTPRQWPFAVKRKKEIDAHFDRLRRVRSGIWNGQVLLLHDYRIRSGVFHGSYFDTEFSSFLSWRDWGFPDASVTNAFAAGALLSSDHAFLLGQMGPHTANAGKIYFPAGTPDLGDVRGDRVDLEAGVLRELGEETGLTDANVSTEPGWHIVPNGRRIALIRILRARETARVLERRIVAHLSAQADPELSGIRIVRGPGDFDPRMPAFVTEFLTHFWSRHVA